MLCDGQTIWWPEAWESLPDPSNLPGRRSPWGFSRTSFPPTPLPMKDISIVAAYFFGVVMDLALWGIHTCLFGFTAWLVYREGRKFTPATLAIYILYLLNIGRTAGFITDAYHAFVTDPLGPENHLVSNPDAKFNLFDDIAFLLGVVIGDLTLLWRLDIIWGRSWTILIVPSTTILLGGITGVIDAFQSHTGWASYIDEGAMLWTYIAFGSTIVTGCLVTALIVGRITYAGRGFHRHPYLRVILVLVESQALNTIGFSVYLVLFVLKSNAGYAVFEALPKITAIAPTLILLKLHLGYTQPMDAPTGVAVSTLRFWRRGDVEAVEISELRFAPAPLRRAGPLSFDVSARSAPVVTVPSQDDTSDGLTAREKDKADLAV